MAIQNIVASVNRDLMSLVVPTAGVLYSSNQSLLGQYTVTCVSTTITTILVPSDTEGDPPVEYSTSSGTVTFTVSTKRPFMIKTNTGSNISVLFTRNTEFAASVSSATLDTVTATGTYNGVPGSKYYVLAVSGGDAGVQGSGSSGSSAGTGGPGGKGGAAKTFFINGALPATTPVVVGAGGTNAARQGGTTTIAGFDVSRNQGGGGGGGGGGVQNPGSPGGGSPQAPTINPIGPSFGGFALSNTGGGGGGVDTGGGGGGRGAGGGGGGGGWTGPPGWRGGGSGGGGGGGANGGGSGAGGGNRRTNDPPLPGGAGGNGGSGAIYILRFA